MVVHSRPMGTRPTVAILGAGAIGEAPALGLLEAGWVTDELVLAGSRPAVHALEEQGFQAIVEYAVGAAAQRSRERGEAAGGTAT